MNTKKKVRVITVVLVLGTLGILGATWWMNGQDDTWFYIAAAVIVLTSLIPVLSGNNKDNNE